MKILFVGTVEFSKKALNKLIELNADIVGVATKERSTFNSDYADLSKICLSHGIDYRYIKNVNDKHTLDWVDELKPDVIFCFGWSQLIGNLLLNSTPMGVIGFHPASLPNNRGRHPIIWALALGLKQTASTFFFMDEGADSGDILSQEFIGIEYHDNARTLYDKITSKALCQIERIVPDLTNDKYTKTPQNHTQANYWRKRGRFDGQIDFRMDSRAVYNLVRALSEPYIGAHIQFQGRDVKIWKVVEAEVKDANLEPGKVLEVNNNSVLVKCYENAVWIKNHEFEHMPMVGDYL